MSDVLGPIMADVEGYQLTAIEKQRLKHSAIGGVILFRRNFQSVSQLKQLVQEIKAIKQPELIVAVDHEGGRVQRFLDGFTRLPAMRVFGTLYDNVGKKVALSHAYQTAWVLANELRSCGIDFSFTPVLDLDWGRSGVIGNRSFHSDPKVVVQIAERFLKGLSHGGMANCGKHYPGHGFVEGDSHCLTPIDNRSWEIIEKNDLLVFKQLISKGLISVMPAHVIYEQIDKENPAGFSKIWLEEILREKLKFSGLIFSDSLTMEGAAGVGNIKLRVSRAQVAGCDVSLICNAPELIDEVLNDSATLNEIMQKLPQWEKMRGLHNPDFYQEQQQTAKFQAAQELVAGLFDELQLANRIEVGEQI